MVRSRWLVLLVLVALSSTASAQSGDPQAARNACRDDAQKLCADVYATGRGVRSCLENQKDRLGAPCRQALGLSQGAPNPWKGVSPPLGPTR